MPVEMQLFFTSVVSSKRLSYSRSMCIIGRIECKRILKGQIKSCAQYLIASLVICPLLCPRDADML